MSGGYRSMRSRYGRLVTHKRYQLVRDYLNRRADDKLPRYEPVNHGQYNAYLDWVCGFERFMCCGLETEHTRSPGRRAPEARQDRSGLHGQEGRVLS